MKTIKRIKSLKTSLYSGSVHSSILWNGCSNTFSNKHHTMSVYLKVLRNEWRYFFVPFAVSFSFFALPPLILLATMSIADRVYSFRQDQLQKREAYREAYEKEKLEHEKAKLEQCKKWISSL